MAFYRRRPRPDAEKCADPAKARASALETLAGQEVSANMLYERLCRRYTEQAAAAAVAEMVQLDYVNDARYAEARAHSLLAARKSRRAAAQRLRQIDAQPHPGQPQHHVRPGHKGCIFQVALPHGALLPSFHINLCGSKGRLCALQNRSGGVGCFRAGFMVS